MPHFRFIYHHQNMAIDLRKNKDSLTKAYNQLVDNGDNTDWVIFGYEGQTPVLKVVATGDGGIDEMAEDLSSGKMLYAYCSVKDPNTSLNKYVLVHWTGESVPENVKLKYTTHLRDVRAFLKAVHVTVTARTETDIDEDDIIKKVSKASGANYSVHKEKAKPEEAPAPVGTDYKRVRPDREINLNERDKFWSQTEKDEITRQKENKVRIEEDRKRIESERKEREQQEAKDRDRRIAERMKEVNVQKAAEQKAEREDQDGEKKKWAQVQKESSIDEEERGHRSDQIRKERMAEAAKLTTSSTAKSRDFFQQKSVERPEISNRGPPPPRKIRHDFGTSAESGQQSSSRKEPIQLPREAPAPVRQPEPEPEPEPELQSHQQEPEREVTPEPEPTVSHATNMLRESLPPRQESDPEEDQDWEEPPEEDITFRDNQVPSVADHHTEEYHPDTQPSASENYPDYAEQAEIPEAESNINPAAVGQGDGGSADQGMCARALYDYQAADDTEITFDPDDIITNIEQIDEGWWQGFSPDGSYGMFPANYVELID